MNTIMNNIKNVFPGKNIESVINGEKMYFAIIREEPKCETLKVYYITKDFSYWDELVINYPFSDVVKDFIKSADDESNYIQAF